MKKFFKKILISFLSFWLLTIVVFDGIEITDVNNAYLKTIIILVIGYPVIKKLLSVVLLPLSFLTLGLINFLQSVILFYILTLLVPEINIATQSYHSTVLLGFATPELDFSRFWTYVLAAFVFSFFNKFFKWVID